MSEACGLLTGCRGLIAGVSGRNSLGYALVTGLSALGAEVAVTYRTERRETCAPLLEAAGVTQHAVLEADDEASIEAALQKIGATLGRLDFLIHTLVHVPDGLLGKPLSQVSREELHAVLDPSAYSLIALCRRATPWLARSAHPRVVTLTSSSAARFTPNYHVAGIAKAALGGALLYLAGELGQQGILCNAVSFSVIDTDGARRAVGQNNTVGTSSYVAKRALTRRPLEPQHVANAVAFFASPLCQNITGETLTVDGGYARGYL